MQNQTSGSKPGRIKKYDCYVPQPGSIRHQQDRPAQVTSRQPLPAVKPLPEQSVAYEGKLIRDIVAVPQSQLKDELKVQAPIDLVTVEDQQVFIQNLMPEVQPDIAVLPKVQKKRFNFRKLRNRMLMGTGALCLSVSLFIVAQTTHNYFKNKDKVNVLAISNNTDEQGVEQGTGDEPAESKPGGGAVQAYTTRPDRPRLIRIPKQGVEARIKELGENNKGNIDSPWNIHDVGWYNGTIVPGSKSGVSLLLGHVSGRKMPGVFSGIKNMVPGDEIEIEMGDGNKLKYSVEKTEEYDLDSIDLMKILYDVPKGEQSLRLMTCSGSFDFNAQIFTSRTVVYAKPVK